MQFEFGNKHLKKLYTKGRSRKYKLPQYIAEKFALRIQQIESAETINDLWQTSSLNFKKLKGFENCYSIRLNRQYRIEVEVIWENEEQTIGKFVIEEVSNHYED